MARIPTAVVERLKTEVSVQRLVEARGVKLKRHGADLMGCCPFHEDRTPSLVITPAKNLWHCLGACQIGGTSIDWVMKAEGISFRHAVELLQNDWLPLAAASSVPPKKSTVTKLPTALETDQDDARMLVQVVDFYHQTLLQSPEALTYLQRRGIGSQEAIETFKLGFANRTLGYRTPDKSRVQGAVLRGQLQRIGILRASGHEHFTGSLVIPIISASGEVTEVYGRKINDNLREGTPYHLYLPGPHRGVWNAAALSTTKEVIVCEALIDALTFWCAGYRNVTAAYGVEGFTADHLAMFKQCGLERVLIAYDCDEAGDRAAQKLAQQLLAEGLDCYRILFPKGMDANEYALKVSPAAKSLGVAIRSAQWLGKGAAPARAAPIPVESHIVAPVTTVAAESATSEDAMSSAPPPSPAISLPVESLPASPLAPAPTADPPCEITENEIVLSLGDRRYRVRGLTKNLSLELMKVNVMVSRAERFHLDTFDFYAAKARAAFAVQAAVELGLGEDIIKHDLGRVLLKLEALQLQHVNRTLAPKTPPTPKMTAAEEAAALTLLRERDLIERIVADFDTCGLVGERTNKLTAYLAAVSRKLDRPLGIVIQSSSAAGKTSLLDAVLAFLPSEERVKYSAMTGQSLFYMGETNLKHKVLAIVEEEGASRASYALKLLQSEGELTIASTGKDPENGNLITQEYRVEGPVALLLTTTARDLDEELLNRCLVLAVDESREQTQAVHRLQRERRTLEGLEAKHARTHLRTLHQNAQRLLKPLEVLNPYAQWLTFPDQTTRLRRDHEKYLTLIDTVAFLHQQQRPVRTLTRGEERIEYIEVSLDDIALANALAHEVRGRSLDELPPQTRRLLRLLDRFVAEQCVAQQIARAQYRFSRRTLREAISWGDTQLRVHLERLVELEYVLPRREGPGGKFVYELVYEVGAEEHQARFPGLIDVAALKTAAMTGKVAGDKDEVAGRLRPARGPVAGGVRPAESAETTGKTSLPSESPSVEPKMHSSHSNGQAASYRHAALA
jgi:DNA primase catalytic core